MDRDEYELRLKRYKERRKKGYNPVLNPTNVWTWRIIPGVVLGLGVLKWLTQKAKRPPRVEDKEELYRRWQAQQDAAEAAQRQQQQQQGQGQQPQSPNRPQAPPRVPPGQPLQLFVKHEAAWSSFEKNPPATVTMGRVPWPPADYDALRGAVAVALQDHKTHADPATEELEVRSQYKRLAMRWHPDKFLARFGGALKEAEREAILDRVKGIQQTVNNTYDMLRQEAEEARGMI